MAKQSLFSILVWSVVVSFCSSVAFAVTEPPQACDAAAAIAIDPNGTSHAFRLDANGNDYVPDASRGGLTFTEFQNGTARLEGAIVSQSNSNKKFDVVIDLAGRVNPGDANYPPPGSPKKELPICDYVDSFLCPDPGPIDTNTWHYYTVFAGDLIGRGGYQGGALDLVYYPGTPVAQAGTGANGKNHNYGFWSYFRGSVTTQPTNPNYTLWPLGLYGYAKGAINIDLDCEDTEPPSCEATFLSDNSCENGVNTITVQGTGSPVYLNFEYDWSADCGGKATTIVENGNQAAVSLVEPLIDEQIVCNLTLTMTDQFGREAVCGTSAPVSACELGCESVDIQGQLALLDGNSFAQNQNVKQLVKILRKVTDNSKAGKKELKQANDLFLENWGEIWTLPPVATACTNEILCVSVSNEPTLQSIDDGSAELRSLSSTVFNKVLKKAKGDQKAAKKAAKLDSAADALHKQNLEITGGLPAAQSVCTQ